MSITGIVLIVLSYFAGSIPFALIAGKLVKGIDIRQVGSGNVGATNTLRAVGKGPSLVVLVLDFLKGALPTLLFWQLSGSLLIAVLCGMATVAGHIWSPYIGFTGGKGVATGLGTLTVLLPWGALLVTLIGVALIALTRYVSLGSIVGAAIVPVYAVAYVLSGGPPEYIPYTFIGAAAVIFQHRHNIKRLLTGREHRLFDGGAH